MGWTKKSRKKRLVVVNEDLQEPEVEATPFTSSTLRLAVVESGEFVQWAGLSRSDLPRTSRSRPSLQWSVLPIQSDQADMYDADNNDDMFTDSLDDESAKPTAYTLMALDGKGEAELLRLLFTLAGQPFDDIIVQEEEVEQVLAQVPCRKLPVFLRGIDVHFTEIPAVVRSMAREFYLLGETNKEHFIVSATYEKLRALKVMHSKACEIITELGDTPISKEKQDWGRHQLRYVVLPPLVGEWDKQILSTSGPFIVPSGITLADLAIMDFLDQCASKFPIDDIICDYLALRDLIMLVKRNEKIAFYLSQKVTRD